MSTIPLLVVAGFVATLFAIGMIALAPERSHGARLAGLLSVAFAAFTLVAISRDGLVQFWTNHTANLVGVQVWWDLLLSVSLAFALLAVRARRVAMNVPLWALFVVATASIGLLAMAARLFVLEHRTAAAD